MVETETKLIELYDIFKINIYGIGSLGAVVTAVAISGFNDII